MALALLAQSCFVLSRWGVPVQGTTVPAGARAKEPAGLRVMLRGRTAWCYTMPLPSPVCFSHNTAYQISVYELTALQKCHSITDVVTYFQKLKGL